MYDVILLENIYLYISFFISCCIMLCYIILHYIILFYYICIICIMFHWQVLISGLRGLGVEVAKNLILAGPKKVILHDDAPTELSGALKIHLRTLMECSNLFI